MAASKAARGAFILFEGVDRCGKTTQSTRLVETLKASGVDAELWRYPDRTTGMGQMINAYLQSKTEMDDGAIHLLFSANRWEKRAAMEEKLSSGVTLVVDRYSYSGVAFTAAKGVPGLDLEWCKAPERGLLPTGRRALPQHAHRGGAETRGLRRGTLRDLGPAEGGQGQLRATDGRLVDHRGRHRNGGGGCGGVRTSRQRRGGPMQDGVGVHQAVAVDGVGVERCARRTGGRVRVGLLSHA